MSLSYIMKSYIQYEISFVIKIHVKVFYIQTWFKCEALLLFFEIKTMIYRKKHLIEKNMKKLLN